MHELRKGHGPPPQDQASSPTFGRLRNRFQTLETQLRSFYPRQSGYHFDRFWESGGAFWQNEGSLFRLGSSFVTPEGARGASLSPGVVLDTYLERKSGEKVVPKEHVWDQFSYFLGVVCRACFRKGSRTNSGTILVVFLGAFEGRSRCFFS